MAVGQGDDFLGDRVVKPLIFQENRIESVMEPAGSRPDRSISRGNSNRPMA